MGITKKPHPKSLPAAEEVAGGQLLAGFWRDSRIASCAELRRASEELLRRWDLDAWDPEREAKHERTRALVVGLLGDVRTRTGTPRQERVALCGCPVVAQVVERRPREGERPEIVPFLPATWARLACRDRWCPTCQRARAEELLPRVAAFVRERIDRGGQLALLTLTRRRLPGEAPRAAIDALLASWKALTHRAPWARVVGGLRALEVTAHKAGDEVRHRGIAVRVQFTGVHAHIHAVIEVDLAAEEERIAVELEASIAGAGERRARARGLARGRWWDGLRAAWIRCSPDACTAAQDLRWFGARMSDQELDRQVRELGAYALDGLAGLLDDVERAPRRRSFAVDVLRALDGRRTLAVFGQWRDLSLRPVARLSVAIAPQPLAAIERRRLAAWLDGRTISGSSATELLAEVARGPRGGIREQVAELRA